MTDPSSAAITCTEARMSLGVLVLGSIQPDERAAVEAHVADCSACTAALADLSPLPGLLHQLHPADVERLAAPAPEGFEARLRSAGREEVRRLDRTRRVRLARAGTGLAAAAAAAVAAGVLLLPGRDPTPPPVTDAGRVVATAGDTVTGVNARFVLRPADEGTRVALSLQGVPPGQHCRLVAVSSSGRRDVAASWVASYAGEVRLVAGTNLALGDIARLDVLAPDGSALASARVPQHS